MSKSNSPLNIQHLDRMEPFFTSLTGDSDVWAFISSTGALSAGRGSPEEAFFPYYTVDKIHDNCGIIGPVTLIRLNNGTLWQPFAPEKNPDLAISRSLTKSVAGNVLEFSEACSEAGLFFSYRWQSSHRFGLVRQAVLTNRSSEPVTLSLFDGVRNVMAAGIGKVVQSRFSCLADAYRSTELLEPSRLGIYALSAGIIDQPVPLESLTANTVWSTGLPQAAVLLSDNSAGCFRNGMPPVTENPLRGERSGYFLQTELRLNPGESVQWSLIINGPVSASETADLHQRLSAEPQTVEKELLRDLEEGTAYFQRLLDGCDASQKTADEVMNAHHCANVTYNMMRGGTPVQNYEIPADDFRRFVRTANTGAAQRHSVFLDSLKGSVPLNELKEKTAALRDPVIDRLAGEYMPLTFSRRHGDPSRPWNNFCIKVRNADGSPRFAYEGNWRDIFQNWEALAMSYPCFLESMISRFVNASTMDGYNPFRITSDGMNWEEPEPDDPWAGIGYWGDHQITYLNKLLEWQESFFPGTLTARLGQEKYVYADVPYEIVPLDEILENPRKTITFNRTKNQRFHALKNRIGSDAALRLDQHNEPYRITLLEKLLVPVLAKLSNLVPGGGIWMNTQRPEWNDANNALVGFGLSMVTVCQLRRHLAFLEPVLRAGGNSSAAVSEPVAQLLQNIQSILRASIIPATQSEDQRAEISLALGRAGSVFRQTVYAGSVFAKTPVTFADAADFCAASLKWLDETIRANLRTDGLYNSYNVLKYDAQHTRFEVKTLYPMLEGQAAILSAGVLSANESEQLLTALRNSPMHRNDLDTYLLYPDRKLPGFLEKGIIPAARAAQSPLLTALLKCSDQRLVSRDGSGTIRFQSELNTTAKTAEALEQLQNDPAFSGPAKAEAEALLALYEEVFKHTEFTGRSGTMFGYEGLGCTYWHMVSKLLLAAQESCRQNLQKDEFNRLAGLYYQVRNGLGFNKTPQEYGAFPTDPYSHTPARGGAKQPGMTGQVKEEVITRFGELGVRIENGALHFAPRLLRRNEFLKQPDTFEFYNSEGIKTSLPLAENELAFTFCQTPVIYRLGESRRAVEIKTADGKTVPFATTGLPQEWSRAVFQRSGTVKEIRVFLTEADILEA